MQLYKVMYTRLLSSTQSVLEWIRIELNSDEFPLGDLRLRLLDDTTDPNVSDLSGAVGPLAVAGCRCWAADLLGRAKIKTAVN